MKLSFLILLLTLVTGFAEAQQINTAKLDSLFAALFENDQALGSVAITKDGKLLYTRAIEYIAEEDRKKLESNTSTKYRIGSITKMFTAVMIFQLVEEGKMALTNTLDNYFPKVPNADQITISQLLNHRSGLHNFTNDADYIRWMTESKSQAEMLDIIIAGGSDFEPDSKAEYSNSNYVLLGYIIEQTSKLSYADFLKKHIIAKLGLKNTSLGGELQTREGECRSYVYLGDWEPQPVTDLSIPGGAGAIISTAEDLSTFIEGLFALKLIKQSSLDQMITIRDGYGMGMFQIPFYERSAYGHNGGIDAFLSTLVYFPEDKLAVSYCANGVVYPLNDILIGILSACFDKAYVIPSFEIIAVAPEILMGYAGVYSSTMIPPKIIISTNGKTLTGQVIGQPAFALETTSETIFEFKQAGVVLEFAPDRNEMSLKQGGGNFLFKKEE